MIHPDRLRDLQRAETAVTPAPGRFHVRAQRSTSAEVLVLGRYPTHTAALIHVQRIKRSSMGVCYATLAVFDTESGAASHSHPAAIPPVGGGEAA
ncbi:MAG: hypothetical protein ACLQVI_00635 [Polyangiaceae bacterium]